METFMAFNVGGLWRWIVLV